MCAVFTCVAVVVIVCEAKHVTIQRVALGINRRLAPATRLHHNSSSSSSDRAYACLENGQQHKAVIVGLCDPPGPCTPPQRHSGLIVGHTHAAWIARPFHSAVVGSAIPTAC